jgi:NADPH:quinone reductase-like Zn-dependent oxidoreductase
VLYDLIFDAAGKISLSDCRKILNPEGRYVSVKKGTAKGRDGDMKYLKELTEAGSIKPVIDRFYDLARIAEAHAYVEKQHKKGNVVITV